MPLLKCQIQYRPVFRPFLGLPTTRCLHLVGLPTSKAAGGTLPESVNPSSKRVEDPWTCPNLQTVEEPFAGNPLDLHFAACGHGESFKRKRETDLQARVSVMMPVRRVRHAAVFDRVVRPFARMAAVPAPWWSFGSRCFFTKSRAPAPHSSQYIVQMTAITCKPKFNQRRKRAVHHWGQKCLSAGD